MNPTELAPVALAFLAGVAVGAAYFGALWWTVQKGVRSKRPALLFVTSFIARTLPALAAFYFIGRGHPARLAICLVGFVLVRLLIVRLSKSSVAKEDATNSCI